MSTTVRAEAIGVDLPLIHGLQVMAGLFPTRRLTRLAYPNEGQDYGAFYQGEGNTILANLVAICVITGWSLVVSTLVAAPLAMLRILRTPKDHELMQDVM